MTDLELQSEIYHQVVPYVDGRIWNGIWKPICDQLRVSVTEQLDDLIYEEVRDQVMEDVGWNMRTLIRNRLERHVVDFVYNYDD